MKTQLKPVPAILLPAILVFMSLAACDSADISSDSSAALDSEETVTALAVDLSSELDLSVATTNEVTGILSKGFHGDPPEPGHLWLIAASLNETLSDEQKERLFARTEQMIENRQGHGFRDRMGRKHRGAGRLLDDILTDEQKDSVKEMREALKEQLETIRAQVKAGELEQDAGREQARTLIQAHHDAVKALLTDEQVAQLEAAADDRKAEREEFREQVKQVKYEVLELSADEIAAFEAELSNHKTAAALLHDQLRDDTIDRDTFVEEMKALRDAHKTFLEETLDEDQLCIVKIHRAIQLRVKGKHRRGQGGPGNSNFEPGNGRGSGPPGGGRPGSGGGPGGRFG